MTRKRWKKCRHCGHDVSPRAESCPNCGEPNPAASNIGCIIIIILVIIVLIFIALRGMFGAFNIIPIPPTSTPSTSEKKIEMGMQVVAIPDSGRVNCRQNADLNAAIIANIEKGETITVVSGPVNADTGEGKRPAWWQVEINNQLQCWVAEFLVSPAN